TVVAPPSDTNLMASPASKVVLAVGVASKVLATAELAGATVMVPPVIGVATPATTREQVMTESATVMATLIVAPSLTSLHFHRTATHAVEVTVLTTRVWTTRL